MQLVVAVDAVIVAVIVRAICLLLRVVVTERGATQRRRIEAGERIALASIRTAPPTVPTGRLASADPLARGSQ